MANENISLYGLWDDLKKWLDLGKRANKTWLTCILGASGLGYVCFSVSSLLSLWAISLAGVNLKWSIDKWLKPEEIVPPEEEPLDFSSKVFTGGKILLAGLLFVAVLTPFHQILIGTIASLALSTFFMSQCVLYPQTKLNNALRNAVTNHNLNDVNTLLKRGADPLDCNAEKNHCFHLAVSNHQNSEAILEALCKQVERKGIEPLSYELLLTRARVEFPHWYKATKTVVRNHRAEENRDLFYYESEQLLNAITVPLRATINYAFQYLRQFIIENNTINQPNQANLTPAQLVDTVITNNPRRAAFFKHHLTKTSTVTATETEIGTIPNVTPVRFSTRATETPTSASQNISQRNPVRNNRPS